MHVIGQIVSNFKDFYKDINPATLSGAIDVIVIQQPDGRYKCSPFYIKFGILEVIKAKNKKVDIYINNEEIDLQMELGSTGDAYFVNFTGPCNCQECKTKISENSTDINITQSTSTPNSPQIILSDSEAIKKNIQIEAKNMLSDTEIHRLDIGDLSLEDSLLKQLSYNTILPEIHISFDKSEEILKAERREEINLCPHPAFDDFHVELSLCGNLVHSDRKPENFDKYIIAFGEFITNPSHLNKNNLVVRINKSYYNWSIAAPIIVSYVAYNSFLPKEIMAKLKQEYLPKKKKGWFSWRRANSGDLSDLTEESLQNQTNLNLTSDPQVSTQVENTTAKLNTSLNDTSNTPLTTEMNDYSHICRRRSKILSSQMLQDLNLKPGPNDILYSVTTRYQGTVVCSARIYLWGYEDRIIISDVDGTITKSDVLGMMLPLVGKDWTQDSVIKLFEHIHTNGYKIVYLTARTIGISNQTRRFLETVTWGSFKLPPGPILMSPSSLLESLHREVILKKPELFKIECLNNIITIFPPDTKPLVAGFGNRVNDYLAYLNVGVPKNKIFIINNKGQIKQEHNPSFLSSYQTMVDFVDIMFPLYSHPSPSCDFHANEFNDFYYWNKELYHDI